MGVLGFDVETTPRDEEQIAHAAKRYARQRVPIRELEPTEYLAYCSDGPLTAKASAVVPAAAGGEDYPVVEGATYELRARWKRFDTVVKSETVETKKSYIKHTHIDSVSTLYLGRRRCGKHGASFVSEGVSGKTYEVCACTNVLIAMMPYGWLPR